MEKKSDAHHHVTPQHPQTCCFRLPIHYTPPTHTTLKLLPHPFTHAAHLSLQSTKLAPRTQQRNTSTQHRCGPSHHADPPQRRRAMEPHRPWRRLGHRDTLLLRFFSVLRHRHLLQPETSTEAPTSDSKLVTYPLSVVSEFWFDRYQRFFVVFVDVVLL